MYPTYLNMNSSYISRVFKEATGQTIMQTINNKKIEKAKEYLLLTDLLIYEIASSIGIDDTTYFSHFFKKHTGYSPKEFKSTTKK